MPLSEEIASVLERHFPSSASAGALGTLPVEEVDRLLRLGGLHPEAGGATDRLVADAIEGALAAGMEQDMMVASAQAFARGLGRVVAAESDNIRRMLKMQPPEVRASYLDGFLSNNLPQAHELFRALHGAMLHEALKDALTDESLSEPEVVSRAIALVDACDSTRFLTTAGLEDTRHLVDALFEAGHAATAEREVWVVKYVGDGVFLLGRDAREVSEAALHGVEVLEREMPLRARAGLAAGPVVRRAGDYFGLTVNIAERLTAAAQPGTLLADESAAAGLPADWLHRRDRLPVRGVEEPIAVVEVRMGARA